MIYKAHDTDRRLGVEIEFVGEVVSISILNDDDFQCGAMVNIKKDDWIKIIHAIQTNERIV